MSFEILQKEDFETKLNDIKYLKDQEHILLKDRIRRLEDELSLIKEVQNDNFFSQLEDEEENEKVKTINIRLSEINEKIHNEIMSHERIIVDIRKENEELTNKNRSLKATIEKMKTELRFKITEKETEYSILKQKHKEKCLEAQEFHSKAKDALKLKKKITDLKSRISKLENDRRDLRDILKEKEMEIEIQKISKKKAIIAERRIAKESEDKFAAMKGDIENKTREIKRINKNKDRNNQQEGERYLSPKERNTQIQSNDGNIQANLYEHQSCSDTVSMCKSTQKNIKRLKSSSPPKNIILNSKRKIKSNRSNQNLINQIESNVLQDMDNKSIIHHHANSFNKYCEACKYKEWRKRQMNYSTSELVINRDIIRFVTCLGCNKSFEVIEFIKHCKDCRLSNKIPKIEYDKNNDSHSSFDFKSSSEDVSEGRRSTENEDMFISYSNIKNHDRSRLKSNQVGVSKISVIKSNPSLLYTDQKPKRKLLNNCDANFNKEIKVSNSIEISKSFQKSDIQQESNLYNYEETSENVNDDLDESATHIKKIINKDIYNLSNLKALKNYQNKETLFKPSEPVIKDDVKKLKREYDEVLDQLKEVKVEYALAVENKNENERILLNEIKKLNSKLASDYKAYELFYSDVKSNSDAGTVSLNYKRRDSRSKPLSEYNDFESMSEKNK